MRSARAASSSGLGRNGKSGVGPIANSRSALTDRRANIAGQRRAQFDRRSRDVAVPARQGFEAIGRRIVLGPIELASGVVAVEQARRVEREDGRAEDQEQPVPESAISTRRLIRVTGRGAARSISSSGSTFGAADSGGSGIDGSSGR